MHLNITVVCYDGIQSGNIKVLKKNNDFFFLGGGGEGDLSLVDLLNTSFYNIFFLNYTMIYLQVTALKRSYIQHAERSDRQTDTLQSTGLFKTDTNSENNLVKHYSTSFTLVILKLCTILKNVQKQNSKNEDFKGI